MIKHCGMVFYICFGIKSGELFKCAKGVYKVQCAQAKRDLNFKARLQDQIKW